MKKNMTIQEKADELMDAFEAFRIVLNKYPPMAENHTSVNLIYTEEGYGLDIDIAALEKEA